MKKIYQTPITDYIYIESEQMIALSAIGTTDTTEDNLSREVSIPLDLEISF
ncbi:MAG: hypothetical protein IKR31_05175 [Prevotella sp.]|jgi:hypothetical protein|nr:hypothetical protein [Prevotella sp.]